MYIQIYIFSGGFFSGFLRTLFVTVSSAALQIPLRRRIEPRTVATLALAVCQTLYNLSATSHRDEIKIYIAIYVCLYVCMYVCMYVCIYVCMLNCINVCMFVCMYIVYVCKCLCYLNVNAVLRKSFFLSRSILFYISQTQQEAQLVKGQDHGMVW